MPSAIDALALSAAAAAGAAVAVLLIRKAFKDPIPPPEEPQPQPTADVAELRRLLAVIEEEILPKTVEQVSKGNKVFGAAILDDCLGTVVADTNHETTCPLYHGEVYTIEKWSELGQKPSAGNSVFLATHEPCCLCISAIVWAGFRKCFYLFPYETTRDQGIPHDLNIMYELWRVPRYATQNKFCSTAGIIPMIEALPVDFPERAEMLGTVARITALYDSLASKYHAEKASNPQNTMAFN